MLQRQIYLLLNRGREICRRLLRQSFSCRLVGGQAIWPADIVHRESKGKTDINEWDIVTQHVGTLANSYVTLKFMLNCSFVEYIFILA
jgi:hypothetical protein